MVLKKVGGFRSGHVDSTSGSETSLLGLKIVGGQFVNGRYCALIEKVKQGSVADLVGHLLPGDEVLEWNGVSLAGRSYEDVRDIVAASRHVPSIELVVSRDILASDQAPHKPFLDDRRPGGGMEDNITLGGPASTSRNLGCRLQVKTWYDRARSELIVTVLSAVDLPSRTGGQYR